MARLLSLLTRIKKLAIVTVPLAALLYVTPALAATAPPLGAAGSFALLGGSAVTCVGPASVAGNVGVYPGSVISGFPTCTTTGTLHAGDAIAHAASNSFLAAYTTVKNKACTQTVLDAAFTGVTLSYAPGVICFAAAATFTNVTINLAGPSNGVWIFKIGTGGTGALTGTSLTVSGSGTPCNTNVYWWTAEAATLTDSAFQGTILSGAAITITRGAFNGHAFAKAGLSVNGPAAVSACGNTTGGGGGGGGDNDKDKDKDKDKDNDNDNDKDGGDDHHDGGGEDHHSGGGDDHGGHNGGGGAHDE